MKNQMRRILNHVNPGSNEMLYGPEFISRRERREQERNTVKKHGKNVKDWR